jgi:hypothetical protein
LRPFLFLATCIHLLTLFRQSRDCVMLRLLMLCLVLISAGAVQAQGFFDYFFGGFEPPPPPPQMRQYWVSPRTPPPMTYVPPSPALKLQRNPYLDAYEQGQELSSKPEKVPPPPVGKGPLGPFLFDATLRSGDVVVTSQGLYVYRGRGGAEHQIRDFIPLARSAVKTPQLVSIDRATRKGKPPIR